MTTTTCSPVQFWIIRETHEGGFVVAEDVNDPTDHRYGYGTALGYLDVWGDTLTLGEARDGIFEELGEENDEDERPDPADRLGHRPPGLKKTAKPLAIRPPTL